MITFISSFHVLKFELSRSKIVLTCLFIVTEETRKGSRGCGEFVLVNMEAEREGLQVGISDIIILSRKKMKNLPL